MPRPHFMQQEVASVRHLTLVGRASSAAAADEFSGILLVALHQTAADATLSRRW